MRTELKQFNFFVCVQSRLFAVAVMNTVISVFPYAEKSQFSVNLVICYVYMQMSAQSRFADCDVAALCNQLHAMRSSSCS